MSGEIKDLVKHGSIYTGGIVLGKIASFLLIPIYTNYLSPSEYGILELLTLTIDIIATIMGVGMAAAVVRFYNEYDDPAKKNLVFSSAIIGTIAIMGSTTVICLALSPYFSKLVFSSENYAYHFRLMFLMMLFNGGVGISMVFLRTKMRSFSFIAINFIKLLFQIGFNIYFLVGLGLGVLGVLYSGLIVSSVLCFYLLISTFRETGIRFSFYDYRRMLGFGAPLIIAGISIFLMTYADRYFLNYFCDLTEVGIYSIAYKFGMLVSILFGSPFWRVWSVKMFEFAKQENVQDIYSRVLDYFLMGSLTISLALAVLTKDVLRIMANPSYWSAYSIVPFIASSYVLVGLISIAGAGPMIKNKTKYKALSTFVAMLVNLILNYLFIPLWGGLGAAFATLIAFFVRLAIDTFYSQKLFYINYSWRKILQMTGIYVILILIAFNIKVENVPISVLTNTLVLAAFPASIYFLGFLKAEEKKIIKSFLRNPISHVRSIVKT